MPSPAAQREKLALTHPGTARPCCGPSTTRTPRPGSGSRPGRVPPGVPVQTHTRTTGRGGREVIPRPPRRGRRGRAAAGPLRLASPQDIATRGQPGGRCAGTGERHVTEAAGEARADPNLICGPHRPRAGGPPPASKRRGVLPGEQDLGCAGAEAIVRAASGVAHHPGLARPVGPGPPLAGCRPGRVSPGGLGRFPARGGGRVPRGARAPSAAGR